MGLENLTMSVMTGICPECGARFCGWALMNPEFQKCDRCGCELEIFRDRVRIVTSNNQVAASENNKAAKITKEEITTSREIINN
jgi:hypothetical protein